MIDNLTTEQMDKLLEQEIVGRIGCYANGTVYVLPISYAYKDNTIYCHTASGLKTEMMGTNPEVCFEVDRLKDMSHWQSVIAWGHYEVISDLQEREEALKILLSRKAPMQPTTLMQLGGEWPFYPSDISSIKGIFFKIVLTKKTGKFEDYSTTGIAGH